MLPGILHGLGSAGVYTPLASQVAESVLADCRMTAMGFFTCNVEIGEGLGAFMLGLTARLLTYPQMFILVALVPFIRVAATVATPLLKSNRG